ncbi:Na+/H+ antiporter subunit B [Rubellimicrobium sp. CFH 75288]|uniref:Na+/H+ antiporter subunit B n=1 Tax=Rubellimicrobium sp. CFH 75288 TaxID=2697034 RepID=UPI00141288E4|nr:Na+/H+ antiporter subunit B [Rubellimicrobium sp. CFH 75288]NAZ35276.1 Na+/H+ antiporter subunit B [Rubellimicrobium sp. CFH 75288]
MNSVILQAGARYLAALLLLFSIHMLLRGHNEPGGGFIGGLIGATGFVIYSLACGVGEARAALRVAPEAVAAIGLALALLAGLLPLFLGLPLFTGLWPFLGTGPDGGKGLPVSSVLLFDIGVYLVVLGSVLTLVLLLEDEGERND